MRNTYVEHAIEAYHAAQRELRKYTQENTGLAVEIREESYPLTYVFSPSDDAMQESLFEPDDNGDVGEMTIICSSGGVGVDFRIKMHIQADVLKKLIAKCTTCAELCLHAEKAARAADEQVRRV